MRRLQIGLALSFGVLLMPLAEGRAQTAPATPAAPAASVAPAAPAATVAPAAAAATVAPPPAMEPRALEILKASCAVLGKAKAMSFDALTTFEKYARNGQPLFYNTLNRVTMQRPNKLRVVTPGDGTPDAFYYDGKQIMAYVPRDNLVAIAEAPPTIDAMVDAAQGMAGIYFPWVDNVLSDPCKGFEEHKLTSAFVIGQSRLIGDTLTDMVAIASPTVQAQIWFGAKDRLPRMVKLVYPKEPAQVLYQTEYSNWRLLDRVPATIFTDAKAAKAHRIPFAPPGLHTPAKRN